MAGMEMEMLGLKLGLWLRERMLHRCRHQPMKSQSAGNFGRLEGRWAGKREGRKKELVFPGSRAFVMDIRQGISHLIHQVQLLVTEKHEVVVLFAPSEHPIDNDILLCW